MFLLQIRLQPPLLTPVTTGNYFYQRKFPVVTLVSPLRLNSRIVAVIFPYFPPIRKIELKLSHLITMCLILSCLLVVVVDGWRGGREGCINNIERYEGHSILNYHILRLYCSV